MSQTLWMLLPKQNRLEDSPFAFMIALHVVALCPLHPTISHAGVGPQSTPVMLPDLSSRLSHMEQSVSLLLSGAPLPADMQKADACTKVPLLLLCTLLALLLLTNELLQHCCHPAVQTEGVVAMLVALEGARRGGGGVQSHSAHAAAFAALTSWHNAGQAFCMQAP